MEGDDPTGIWLLYDCDSPERGGIIYGVGATEVLGDRVSLGRGLDVTPPSEVGGFNMVCTPRGREDGGNLSSLNDEDEEV